MRALFEAVLLPRGSLHALEDPLVVLGAGLAKDVALDVFVAEEAVGVVLFEHADKVVEAWVELAQVVRPEGVGLCPMRPAFVACENRFEAGKELPVGHVEPVRPVQHACQKSARDGRSREMYALVLYDAYPGRALPAAGAQPDVVRVGEAYLEWEVRSQAVGIRVLLLEPVVQLPQTGRGVHIRDGPLRGVLRVLADRGKVSLSLPRGVGVGAHEPCNRR